MLDQLYVGRLEIIKAAINKVQAITHASVETKAMTLISHR